MWSKRVLKLLAFTMLVVGTCVALGIWQIARLHQKQEFNAAVRAGLDSPILPLDALLSPNADPEAVRYLRVEATGTYDIEHETVLYGRTQDSRSGNHLLTPLILADGTSAILVDRGWVPIDVDRPGAAQAAPPMGEVRLGGVLFTSEGGPPASIGDAPSVQTTLSKIDLARIQSQLPYRIAPMYLLLQTQSPAQHGNFPVASPPPELTEGPHLGYAIQWFTFAVIAIVGFVILARRERTDRRNGPTTAPME